MNETPDNDFQAAGQHQRPCRVSYTLNNFQPVRCTIVSDQPLFYMDFEESGEEGLFEDIDIEEFAENCFAAETGRLTRKFWADSDEDRTRATMDMFETNMSDMLGGVQTCGQVHQILETLGKSRYMAAHIEQVLAAGTRIIASNLTETAFYARRDNVLLVNTGIAPEQQLLSVMRELRRAWQHRQGVLLHPMTFHPDHAVLVNRAQIADLGVAMVRAAWELQLAGEKLVWDKLERTSLSDLAAVFAREAFLDFRTINNGAASAAVFEAWFLSERCRRQDKLLIQQMLADYQGYVFENEHMSKVVTAEIINGLGAVPYGKNYLAAHAGIILADPIFTDVRDRSNANFLWFIKFEKSFRETEQELQNGQTVQGQGVSQNLHTGQTSDIKRKDSDEPKAEIIVLPQSHASQSRLSRHAAAAKGMRRRRAGKSQLSHEKNVIDLNKWISGGY